MALDYILRPWQEEPILNKESERPLAQAIHVSQQKLRKKMRRNSSREKRGEAWKNSSESKSTKFTADKNGMKAFQYNRADNCEAKMQWLKHMESTKMVTKIN